MSKEQNPDDEATYQHILKPLTFKEIDFSNKVMYGFDIETYSRENKFLFASLTNDDGCHCFYSEEELFNFLMLPENYNAIIIVTNLQFDYFGSFLYKYHEHLKPMIRNGRLISSQLIQYKDKTNSKSAHFYDTMQLYMTSVKNLGKGIGIQKIKYPPNFVMNELTEEEKEMKLEPTVKLVNYPKDEKEWKLLEEYCHNDALISYKWFKDVYLPDCIESGIKPSFTSASHSLKFFRVKYLDEELHVDPTHHDIVRASYYGGRTECIKRGYVGLNSKNKEHIGKIACFDFNSLYPSCMLETMPHPNHEYYKKQCSMKDILEYEGCTYVEGYQEERYITLLPYKIDVLGTTKLIFPCGYLKGYWMNIELREAIKQGFTINKFGDGLIYTKTKPFFNRFVTDGYNKRLKLKNECQKCKKINTIKDAKVCECGGVLGNPAEAMEKLKLNSHYGKYAQVYSESTTLIPAHAVCFNDMKFCVNSVIHKGTGHEWLEIKNENGEPNDYSLPIFSAQITAIARLKLFKLLNQKEIQNHLCYLDTDSLFLKSNFKVPSSDKLGDVKLEYECNECIFVKPKFYISKNPKIKGVNSVKTKSAFMNVIKNKKVVEDAFVRFTTAIKSKPSHKMYGKKVNELVVKEKDIDLEDSKRDWLGKEFDINDLQDSMPFYINQKQEVCIRKGNSYVPVPKRKLVEKEVIHC